MKHITFLIAALTIHLGTIQAQHNTFYIGHSGFGWDLIVGDMVNDLAIDAGITTYNHDFQFIGGTCVNTQWVNHANPQGGMDSWVALPTGNYDIVVLAEQIPIAEVIDHCWPTNISSVTSNSNFYNMAVNANPNTRMYLMAYHDEIDRTGPTPHQSWVNQMANMRPLWERVVDSVTLLHGGPQMCIVPVAKAFEYLADSTINGRFPGYTNWIDLFDPNDPMTATIHPTEETYYLVACVHYAVFFGQSPEGLTNITHSYQSWPFDPPTPAQALVMQRIAWEVVSNDPYACMPITTGINAQEHHTDVKLSPNPASSQITIKGINEVYDLSLYNALGQLLYAENDISAASKELDISAYEQGVIFVRIESENGVSFQKVVKE